MTQETSTPGITDQEPDPGSREWEATPGPAQSGTSTRRVPLDRLLTVVVLSPAQASLVAVRVLDAAQLRRSANGTHPADADRWAVGLTPSGEIEVDRAPAGEGARASEVLEQLSQNARRLPAHPRSEQLVLLRRLEDAAADPQPEPGARARELEGALAEVLGPGSPQRLAGQLAALLAAFAHIAPSVAVPVAALAAPGAARPGPHRAAPTRSLPSRPPRRGHALGRRRARTRRRAFAVVLLVAALAATGYVMLRSPGNGIAGALGRDHQAGTPPRSAPSGSKGHAAQPQPRPRHHVQALAKRHAGPVTGLEVQRNGRCTPGSRCPVTVTVHLRAASTARSVAWKVGAARWCGNGVTWSPPTSVTAQPGWTRVFASSSVPVPRGRSLALVALTAAPARAQSRPVPVTGSSLRC